MPPAGWTTPTSLASAAALVVGLAAFAPVSTAPSVQIGVDAARIQDSRASAAKLPDRIDVPRKVRQLVTVTSGSFDDTGAVLRAWRRDRTSGDWRRVGTPVTVRLGYNGWVKGHKRSQGTGTTPAGEYTLPYAFGRWADPGAKLNYRRVDGDDWWPYDRRDHATYNVYQRHRSSKARWRSSHAEHLNSYQRQYGYAMVVGFNLPSGVHYSERRRQWVARERADKHAGGGIFLHVNGSGLTAGCVSMSRKEMKWLVRWVNPKANPRIVMGPTKYVVKL